MEIDKRERIIRVLLTYPKGSISTYQIAKESKTSRSWTIEFLQKLEKTGLITKIHSISKNKREFEGAEIIDIIGLFSYWIEISRTPYIRSYNVKNPLEILKNTNLKYALTTYQAETLAQNYLFPSRMDFYILKNDVNKWEKLLLKDGLVGAGNVKIIIGDEHVFYKNRKRKGYRIVCYPQLIVDLLKEGGIAIDAANLLIRKWYSGFI